MADSAYKTTTKANNVMDGNQNVKRYMDIDVGLKMNSYTVNGLQPGIEYLFELCLRKGIYDRSCLIIHQETYCGYLKIKRLQSYRPSKFEVHSIIQGGIEGCFLEL